MIQLKHFLLLEIDENALVNDWAFQSERFAVKSRSGPITERYHPRFVQTSRNNFRKPTRNDARN